MTGPEASGLAPRPFGRTGFKVSPLALGTVKFGRNQGLKLPQAFELPDMDQLARLLDAAHDLGINLLDTAPAYGLAEERLGQLLRARRGQFLIATKAGEDFANGQSHFDFSRAAIADSIERSLSRLGQSCLDLVFIHSDGVDEGSSRFDGAFEALHHAKAAGMIRAIGFSGKTLNGGRAVLPHCDALMIALNPGYRDEWPLIAEARAVGCAVVIKKALASGHLVAKNEHALQSAFDLCLRSAQVDTVVVGTLSAAHLAADAAAAYRAITF